MRGNEFLDKMELVNSEYVEAAEKVPYKKKKKLGQMGGNSSLSCNDCCGRHNDI